MRNSIWTLFVLTILSSCVTQQRCLNKFPPQTVTIIKDSIVCVPDSILIPGKTVTMESTSPCPPAVVFHSEIKKNGLTSVVDIRNGVLTQTCKEDSLKHIIETERHFRNTVKQIVLPAKEVYLTHWYDIMARWVAIVLFLIWVVIIFDRTILKGKI